MTTPVLLKRGFGLDFELVCSTVRLRLGQETSFFPSPSWLHRIRYPITSLNGYIFIMQASCHPSGTKKYIYFIPRKNLLCPSFPVLRERKHRFWLLLL